MHPYQRTYFERLWQDDPDVARRLLAEEQAPGGRIWHVRRLLAPGPLDVLDVGCGTGELVEVLQAHGHRARGFDCIEAAVEAARRRGLDCVVGDAEEAFPAKGASMDCVIAGLILEHLVDMDHFFVECRRVLRPGGKLIVTVPNGGFFLIPLALLFCQTYATHSTQLSSEAHIRFFTWPQFRRWMERHGFTAAEIYAPRMVHAAPPTDLFWLKYVLRGVVKGLVRVLGPAVPTRFADQLLIVARLKPVSYGG